jgi:SHS2 domain-containing protein
MSAGDAPRRHEVVAHTADVGLRASASDLPSLFEEAAVALAELAADVAPGAGPSTEELIDLEATDLTGLAYGWLNELIGLADARRAVLVSAAVRVVARGVGGSPAVAAQSPTVGAQSPAGGRLDGGSGWRLEATARFAPLGATGVRPRLGVKSATYHALDVDRDAAGWTLVAYLDV